MRTKRRKQVLKRPSFRSVSRRSSITSTHKNLLPFKRGGRIARSINRAPGYSRLAACGLSNANPISWKTSQHTRFCWIPQPLHAHHKQLACFHCAKLCHVAILFLSLATGLRFSPLFFLFLPLALSRLYSSIRVHLVALWSRLWLSAYTGLCRWPSSLLC